MGAPKERVRFEVIDRGPGVPKDELPRIFEPFYRSGQRGHGNLGLGLSLVDRIARAHGGSAAARPPRRRRERRLQAAGLGDLTILHAVPRTAFTPERETPNRGAPEKGGRLSVSGAKHEKRDERE